MAVSGLILAGFALVHMVGNLQMFQTPEHINVYAHFLQHLPPPALWGFRSVMLLSVAVHVWTGISLALENRIARPEKYDVKNTRVAGCAAKTMPYTGVVLFAFIVFHIFHYTVKLAVLGTDQFKGTLSADVHAKLFGVFDYPIFKGEHVNDAYNMVVAGFSITWVSVFYIVAMLLIFVHLSHGVSSVFQTIGLRNEKWRWLLSKVAIAYGGIILLGLAAVPAGVLAGKIVPDTKCPVAIKAAAPHIFTPQPKASCHSEKAAPAAKDPKELKAPSAPADAPHAH
jgi:succinate dehydrogenase / fumarate reductase cytochrome b subunit